MSMIFDWEQVAILRKKPKQSCGAADGYTILLVGTANAINATLYEGLSFDFIQDIAPVAGIFRIPNVVVVNPSLPVQTIPQLIGTLRQILAS